MTSVQPGWYPDHTGSLRWWDGQQWTEHVYPGAVGIAGTAQEQVPQDQSALPHVQAPRPAAAPPKLRHRGAAWAIAGVVALGMLGSGVSLAIAAVTQQPPAESGEGSSERATTDSEADGPAPLVTREPVSDKQAALLESTVEDYNNSFVTKNCEGYNATTNSAFKQDTGECSGTFFDGMSVSNYSFDVREASQTGDGVYELRADESFTLNGEQKSVRYAYILVDDPQAERPVIEMIVDRN